VVFSSVPFIFYFLPVFLIFFYVCGARNGALLTGSLVFYTWGEGAYLFLLGFLVAANFYFGQMVSAAEGRLRTLLLVAGVTANLAMLAFFKYTGFIVGTVVGLTGAALPKVEIHLPLGISFFTFQLISYLVDVARREVPADRGFIRFATYIMMFPHLIAGPIVRYADIDTELHKRDVTVEKIGLGIQSSSLGSAKR
jgi:alginate O-acetyltransferase complex protein AlgI